MSKDKVDAREAYLAEAKRLAQLHACEKALESLKSDDAPDSEKTLHTLMEHLRTQPEVVPPMVLAATLTISPFKGYENTEFQYHGNLSAGTYALYAAQEGK